MISLIIASAAVSLVTIGILFIQRIRPKKLRIPSYFLGESGEKRLSSLRTLPPRWWEWLLVILATIGLGFAYFSQSVPNESNTTRGQGLVWIDPSLSHIVSLSSSAEAQESALEALRSLRLGEYIFIELDFALNGEKSFEAKYNFTRVAASSLAEYLQINFKKLSALSQPLDPDILIQSIKKEELLDPSRATLTLVTDAQAETMRPLSSLASKFEAINILRTPRISANLSGRRTPVIPEELAQLWTTRSGSSEEPALPSTPHFVKVDGPLAGKVPPQARPTLSLEEFSVEGVQPQNQPGTAIIVGEDSSSDGRAGPRGVQPLLTTCTLDIAGPTELDGMADLRAYAQFFKIPVRPLQCRSTESASSARAAESLDPWKFRRASIWVIPVNEYVGGQLLQQGIHWIPEGFAPETDAIVYIADTRLQGSDSFLEEVTLQLEENQPALRMPLLPMPPAQIVFPWELGKESAKPMPKPISTDGRNSNAENGGGRGFKSLLTAADGTPLAFQLSQKPPAIYLRTGGAAPNGELGRWGKWASLWNELRISLGQRSPLLTRVQLKNPSEWSNWLKMQTQTNTPPLRYKIDLETLKGRVVEDKQRPILPEPALYVRERDDQLVLVEPDNLERQNQMLSAAELEQLFPRRGQVMKSAGAPRPSASSLQILGAIVALFSVLLLWLLQKNQQKSSTKNLTSTATLLFLIASPFFFPLSAVAQGQRSPPVDMRTMRGHDNRPSIPTFPFRIAWCDATIPELVNQRYAQLQGLLAGRGTIDLPKQMTAGACRVGAAEIWWTSSLDALTSAQVTQHIRSGGVIIAEGISLKEPPEWMIASADPSIGLVWESPKRRGLLYRSFYLLSSFDGCTPERTLVLTLRKKVNALAPMAIVTPARFLTNTSEGADCFIGDDNYRSRSFVNMMYALLTTDYKEDQMQLPEILNRVRSLGLEP